MYSKYAASYAQWATESGAWTAETYSVLQRAQQEGYQSGNVDSHFPLDFGDKGIYQISLVKSSIK